MIKHESNFYMGAKILIMIATLVVFRLYSEKVYNF